MSYKDNHIVVSVVGSSGIGFGFFKQSLKQSLKFEYCGWKNVSKRGDLLIVVCPASQERLVTNKSINTSHQCHDDPKKNIF